MTHHDHGNLVGRAVSLIRDEFTDAEQPRYWPRQQPRVVGKHAPEAIFVHADTFDEDEIAIEDAIVHAFIAVTDEDVLFRVNDEDDLGFPTIDDIENVPANYRWLVLPDNICSEDDSLLESLREECSSRGVGLILCYADEDYDEIFSLAEPESGAFLSAYGDVDEIMDALSKQADRYSDMEEYESEYGNFDYYNENG